MSSYAVLKPHRALAENWEVDIEEDLLHYLCELDSLGGSSSSTSSSSLSSSADLNFAKAALLVQNSALVYGRKVDMLYELVFKALEDLSVNAAATNYNASATTATARARTRQSKAAAAAVESASAADAQYASFAPLDEIPSSDAAASSTSSSSTTTTTTLVQRDCGRVAGLCKSAASSSAQSHPRLLTASSTTVSALNKSLSEEFNISRMSIDANSGLLQLEQEVMMQQQQQHELDEEDLVLPALVGADSYPDDINDSQNSALAPVESQEGYDDDYDGGGGGGGGEYYGDDAASSSPPPPPAVVMAVFLDPHVPSATRKDKPFARGKVFTLPSASSASSTAQFAFGAAQEEEEEGGGGDDGGGTMTSANESILSWLGVAGASGSSGGQRWSKLSFPEFDKLCATRRRQRKALLSLAASQHGGNDGNDTTKLRAAQQPATSSGEESYDDYGGDGGDVFGDDNGHYGGGDDGDDDYDGPMMDASFSIPTTATTNTNNTTSLLAVEDHDAHLAQLSTYSEVVRSHVDRFLETCRNWAQESKLSVRVNHWHRYLAPLLEREASRPVFDLKQSQRALWAKLPVLSAAGGIKGGAQCSFDALVAVVGAEDTQEEEEENKAVTHCGGGGGGVVEKWQVCRMFLTTLVLANSGAVEIHQHRQDKGEDDDDEQRCLTEKEFQLVRDAFMVVHNKNAASGQQQQQPSSPRLPAAAVQQQKKRMRMSAVASLIQDEDEKENR